MRTIAAAKFKEQCLALLDSVDDDGLLITKRGRVVARLLPVRNTGAHLIGALGKRLEVHGDVMTTGIAWESAVAEP